MDGDHECGLQLSPEDIASGVLSRLFYHEVDLPSNVLESDVAQRQMIFNEIVEFPKDVIYPLITIEASDTDEKVGDHSDRQTESPVSSQNHGNSKFRHKSPMNRPFSHAPVVNRGLPISDSTNFVRKTRSTALPASASNAAWSRGGTASTPDMNFGHRKTFSELPSWNNLQPREKNRSTVRSTNYYNAHLVYLTLNCIMLAVGLLHVAATITFGVYKDTILAVAKYEQYLLSITCLSCVSFLLLSLSSSGLCLAHRRSKIIATHAGCSLTFAAIVVCAASVESNAQMNVLKDAGVHMLSTLKQNQTHSNPVWDNFQHVFKCCGVRGYLDWCEKQELRTATNKSMADDFLERYTCKLPASCCMGKETLAAKTTLPSHFGVIPCTLAPTPWNIYQTGCLTPINAEILHLGKLYRVSCFATAIVMFLSAGASVFLYVHS